MIEILVISVSQLRQWRALVRGEHGLVTRNQRGDLTRKSPGSLVKRGEHGTI